MRPNIVWITLDSVRADHCSTNGYRRQTTPEMERIGSDGVILSSCFSHGNRTPVSVPSMLTGRLPTGHGVGLQGGRCGVIPSDINTVPERLSEVGYHTHGISPNPYAGPATGLNDRFDGFDDIGISELAKPEYTSTLVKYLFNLHTHADGFSTNSLKYSTPFLVNDIAKKRMKRFSERDDPFFLYLHYNEPHRPYFPPRATRDEYLDDIQMDSTEAMSFAAEVHEHAYEHMAHGLQYSEDQWDALSAMYDAEIKYTDSCVGRIYDFIQSLDDDVIVVVTADHGELFGEYGLLDHQIVLHDAVTHVPMVVSGLEEIEHHAENIVQHTDVMRTLLAITGADDTGTDGVNLRSNSREFAIAQDVRGTVADDDAADYERFLNHNPEFDVTKYPKSLLTAVRSIDYKLCHTAEYDRIYQLPDEETEVTAPKVMERHRAALDTVAGTVDPTSRQTHSDNVKKRLSDLGYIG